MKKLLPIIIALVIGIVIGYLITMATGPSKITKPADGGSVLDIKLVDCIAIGGTPLRDPSGNYVGCFVPGAIKVAQDKIPKDLVAATSGNGGAPELTESGCNKAHGTPVYVNGLYVGCILPANQVQNDQTKTPTTKTPPVVKTPANQTPTSQIPASQSSTNPTTTNQTSTTQNTSTKQ